MFECPARRTPFSNGFIRSKSLIFLFLFYFILLQFSINYNNFLLPTFACDWLQPQTQWRHVVTHTRAGCCQKCQTCQSKLSMPLLKCGSLGLSGRGGRGGSQGSRAGAPAHRARGSSLEEVGSYWTYQARHNCSMHSTLMEPLLQVA